MAILKQANGGFPAAEFCGERGMSSATLYKSRSKYRGIGALMISQINTIEDATRRLKNMFSELSMQIEFVKDTLGKIDRPSECRQIAERSVRRRGINLVLDCKTFGVSATIYRYSLELKTGNE